MKFQEVLKESQEAQEAYKECAKDKIVRQVKVVDADITEDQIEDICKDPEGAQKLISEKIMGDVAHLKVQNAVSDLQDKVRDIQALERSMEQVHQMFLDMALLVQEQGQYLDNINQNVGQARDYVGKGNKNLTDAKRYQQQARRRTCYVILIVTIILVVIVAPILSLNAA